MSVTSIQFIGLFVVMMNSGAGLHILLPHFPNTPYAGHTSVIQFSPEQVASLTWPSVTSCGLNGSLRCAPINLETITFAGAIDPAPIDIVGNISHLRCCCASMTDILAKYKDPNATGKLSAHIFVARGMAEAIPSNGRIDTWVTMHSMNPTGITVVSNAGTSGSFNIVFKPGAQFSILNTTTTPSPSGDFQAYYLMGIGSSGCTAVPSDGPPCAPQATECALPKLAVKKPSAKAATTGSSSAKVTGLHPKRENDDVDCANSHWP